jgi:hypothetical protein
MIAALLIGSSRSECQQPDGEEAAGANRVQDGCRSVVLVECAQTQPQAAVPGSSTDSLQTTRQKLDRRRLRQMQAQAGLNAIEITAERPPGAESDPWEGFRQSVASAAVPGCLRPEAPPQRPPFEPQGLLALPFLLHAAAVGKCR